jgi:hypothetical protein
MKKFVIGLSAGYLLTSFFSIQAPTTLFWIPLTGFLILAIPSVYVWHRINDDIYDGEF